MSTLGEKFNRTAFSRFLNSTPGRVFRLVGGTFFLVVGIVFREHWLGIVSILWSIFPLTAGGFDVCYFSAALGGPFSGKKIRTMFHSG